MMARARPEPAQSALTALADRTRRQIFERLLALCNDVGLISEEYDVQRRRLVGGG